MVKSVQKNRMKAFMMFAVLFICSRMHVLPAEATFDLFSDADSLLNGDTVFTEYLYKEGCNYTEISDDFVDTVVYAENETIIHVLSKKIEVDGMNCQVKYSYYSSMEEDSEESLEVGEIICCFIEWEYDTDTDAIMNYVQNIYGEFDYVDDSYDEYVAYQIDSVENNDYDIELIFADTSYCMYFFPGSRADYGTPVEVFESLNNATSVRAIAELSLDEISEEEIEEEESSYSSFSISVEVNNVIRVSREYGEYMLTNKYDIPDFWHSGYDSTAGIFVLNANLFMSVDDYYVCENWDVIFVYNNGWKILDTIYNYDIDDEVESEMISENDEAETAIVIGEENP